MYQIDRGIQATEKVGSSSHLTFHRLLGNWRITEKLFTEQDKEFSAFIPSNPSTAMKAKQPQMSKDQGTDIKARQTN